MSADSYFTQTADIELQVYLRKTKSSEMQNGWRIWDTKYTQVGLGKINFIYFLTKNG